MNNENAFDFLFTDSNGDKCIECGYYDDLTKDHDGAIVCKDCKYPITHND